ncbi:TPA: transposase, partial [Enterococcus faecium]|uniref:transposase n=1 Tax=Enterococcus lactis TaxID=357441 RepID=UPI001A0E8162
TIFFYYSTLFDSRFKTLQQNQAKNTHIKTMKRVSYGFKSFENMRIRIFLINQLINVR